MNQYTINTVCSEYSPTITVRGQVFDVNSNESLPFANIYNILDHTVGTAADMDGKFSLEIPKGETLVASFVGYHPIKFIAENNFAEVYLTPDDQLDPVEIHGVNKNKSYSWLWWILIGGAALKVASKSGSKKPALGQPMNVKL
ncbi:MAG: carboxypeptidase-like regulatory domain-containing protein [Bacteroidota bacterium]